MSLSSRRRQSAAAKGRNAVRRAAQRANASRPRPCQMAGCPAMTTRPLGYCDTCWEGPAE